MHSPDPNQHVQGMIELDAALAAEASHFERDPAGAATLTGMVHHGHEIFRDPTTHTPAQHHEFFATAASAINEHGDPIGAAAKLAMQYPEVTKVFDDNSMLLGPKEHHHKPGRTYAD